jgi:hypothetical protein
MKVPSPKSKKSEGKLKNTKNPLKKSLTEPSDANNQKIRSKTPFYFLTENDNL